MDRSEKTKLARQCFRADGRRVVYNSASTVHWRNHEGDIMCGHPIAKDGQWSRTLGEVTCPRCVDHYVTMRGPRR